MLILFALVILFFIQHLIDNFRECQLCRSGLLYVYISPITTPLILSYEASISGAIILIAALYLPPFDPIFDHFRSFPPWWLIVGLLSIMFCPPSYDPADPSFEKQTA